MPQTSITYIPATSVACTTLLVYDYVCTLDLEIAFIWPNAFTFTGLLFFLNRYMPFVDTFLQLDLLFGHNTVQKCHKNDAIMTWFIVLGVLVSEMILAIRTYAFWLGDKRVLILFIVLVIFTVHSPQSYPQFYYPSSTVCGVPCLVFVQLQLATIQFVGILTIVKASKQRSSSPWVMRLYSDSIIFYVYMLIVSLINVILPIAKPEMAKRSAGPLRIFHSILCNRIIFRIQGHTPALLTATHTQSPTLSTVAPLDSAIWELTDISRLTEEAGEFHLNER
ncbi:hypothetical protein CYLTODRAFT_454557 [Cylindrobasidium torrendii FP15055 ss-10]|uniref:DUF6533 domain-containing protein n=1 Tax=Cylindrobasidium torrendii FP15055 ss-10 TaxID=1314674 RepID=A0A0D7BAW6_9AGAR|nr:hypothetical protein CYLTODRAFT_454557 [Cylindrobasidium torrendii FP15055 ss-10]